MKNRWEQKARPMYRWSTERPVSPYAGKRGLRRIGGATAPEPVGHDEWPLRVDNSRSGDADRSARIDPGRAKTRASQERVEPFSLLSPADSRRQHFGFQIDQIE